MGRGVSSVDEASARVRRASSQVMKCLITGGSGFVGSHLADRLLEQGHTVMVIDDLTTGSIQNILHFKGNPRFQYVIDSVQNGCRTASPASRDVRQPFALLGRCRLH